MSEQLKAQRHQKCQRSICKPWLHSSSANPCISVAHLNENTCINFCYKKRFHDHSKSHHPDHWLLFSSFPFFCGLLVPLYSHPFHQFLLFPFTLCLSATGTSLIQLLLVQDVLLGKGCEHCETGEMRFYCTSLTGRHGDFVLGLPPWSPWGPWIFRHMNWLWCEVLRTLCGHLSKTWLNWILFNAVLHLWPCWEDLEGLSAV